MVDSEVICCTRLVEAQLPATSKTVVISELSFEDNHYYIPLPMHPVPQVEVKRKVAEARRTSVIRSSLAATDSNPIPDDTDSEDEQKGVKKPDKKNGPPPEEEFYKQPRFAASRLFVSNVVISLAANTFYSPSLSELVCMMVGARVVLVPTHKDWVGKSYFEYFDHLLFSEGLLAIGLYREALVPLPLPPDEDDEELQYLRGSRSTISSSRSTRNTRSSSASRKTNSRQALRKTVKRTAIDSGKPRKPPMAKQGYVYTAPPGKGTVMLLDDRCICFAANPPAGVDIEDEGSEDLQVETLALEGEEEEDE